MEADTSISIVSMVLTVAGSGAVMYSQRVAFEARMKAELEALRADIQRLAGADARIAVLEHSIGALERRLDTVDRLLTRIMGNVVAIATQRGMAVRQETPQLEGPSSWTRPPSAPSADGGTSPAAARLPTSWNR